MEDAMRTWIAAMALVMSAGIAVAQGWHEPARGTAERAALMDAVRPAAEVSLGAPVEFVVRELRVSGDLAFAMLHAQRPGGQPIDLERTPGYLRGEFSLEFEVPTEVQALLFRRNGVWVADQVVLGATDVWWIEFCPQYYPVISDACAY